ncbi:hypothetical protein GPECTOR_16g753 [Gonium pectorale]|uniref:Protein kinase domain-containing protein n=1 Tax=Gonium pectorale TaxID=33097 RepID=A0A150GLB8_GONPE|nr:hypothetical protein GPECTOR_16g753 [Gonium pectorale]|eukprot:KXZ50578.1 hypothetical protein GPECTOR_16g753 [Gonium pectorale]
MVVERSKELSFSVRNSADAYGHQGTLEGAPPPRDGFMGELQIHERIGGGSSARVYRGTLDGTISVAVKVLHPHAAQREATLQEFLREAQILARLQHKHIVRLHALAHLPPSFAGLPTRRFTWGIVTELMEAGTLTKLVQDAAKALKQQQKVKQQMAAAAAAVASNSVGGGTGAPTPERTTSLRQLKNSLSFLRRGGALVSGEAPSSGGIAGAGGGGGLTGNTAVPPTLPSPRLRPGTGAGGCSPLLIPGIGGGGGAGGGMSSRQGSATALELVQLPYTDREALQWCMEVALALQFLHAQTPPVVHRDVKTDNVLMAVLPPLGPLPPSSVRGGTDTGMAPPSAAAGALTPQLLSAIPGGGGERERGGVAGVLATHGSLVRRVLSMRVQAAMASEGLASRAGSMSVLARPGGGRPLTAKVCDFGLHVVLDMSRPVVTVRRRSFEASYTGDGMAVGSAGLPHSGSLNRPSARNSPAGTSAAGSLPGGPVGPAGGHGSGLYAGGPPGGSGRYEPRSRRPSLMSNRGNDDVASPYRRAISRDGDSFSRAQGGFIRKHSNLSHNDSLEPSGSNLAAVAANALASSPPKAGPFNGGAAAAAAAAAAFGTSPAMVGGIARLSSSASSAAAMASAAAAFRAAGSGASPANRSPKISGAGSTLGGPKWSGGSTAPGAPGIPQTASVTGFAAARASLDLLLQGRLSASAVVAAVSQSAASSHSGAPAGAAAAAAAAAAGPGSNSGVLPGGGSNGGQVTPHIGEVLSTAQVMMQLQGSNTGTSDRTSRLRPSYAGPSAGNTSELPPCLTIEAALRMANRSGGGRASASTVPASTGAPLMSGSGAPAEPLSAGGLSGRVLAGGSRAAGGSPAASSKGTRAFRSNAAQVAQYLAMMEEDLQLDLVSRSSSKAQAEMDPLCGSRPGSHHSTAIAAGRSAANSVLLAAGLGGLGSATAPGGPTTGGISTLSNRSLLSAGPSQGHMPGPAQMLQAGGSTSRLSPAGKTRNSPVNPHLRRPSQPGGPVSGRLGSRDSLTAAIAAAAAGNSANALLSRAGRSGSGPGMAAQGSGICSPSRVGSEAGGGSLDGHGRFMRVRSDASAKSDLAAAVVGRPTASLELTGATAAALDGSGGGSGSGGGGSPAVATAGGPATTGLAARAIGPSSGSGLLATFATPSPARGPNPSKSSSQPALSVSGDDIALAAGAAAATAAGSGSGALPRPTRAMSSGSRAMSKLSGLSGPVTARAGSGSSGHRSPGGAAMAPTSPTDSVHPMDLSPPAARVIRGPSRQRLVAMPSAADSMGADSESGAEDPVRRRQDSNATAVSITSPFIRRKYTSLEVSVPKESLGPIIPVTTRPSPRGTSAGSGAAAAAAAPDPSVGAAAAAAAPQVPPREPPTGPRSTGALPGHAASGSAGGAPDGHEVAAQPSAVAPSTAAAAAGGAGTRTWLASSGSTMAASAAALPRPRNLSAGTTGAVSGPVTTGLPSDTGSFPAAAGAGSGPPHNRELHKVVKRLRPDGGGSFTGNSPLGLLPPGSPGAADGSGSGGLPASAVTAGGSFSYSRRASMDTLSFHSITSGRSMTAAAAGGVAAGLHRDKLLWPRGSGLAGGAGVTPVVYTSDPNSPVSSYSAQPGSSGALARAVPPMRAAGAALGAGGGAAPGGAAGVVVPGSGGVRTTSGGVSGTSGGNSALASPMLAHVTGVVSQSNSVGPGLAARMVSESAASGTTLGGWTGRDELPPQGEAAYALTGRAGTLLYMAPEVIRHEPYNEKVDVFSFGVVLYEVFGRILLLESYSRDELENLSARIAQGFRHHRPDCMPQAIWDIVQQCWAQNPADRPTMPLVVRHLELAMEALAEAEAATAAASGAHRPGSQFGDGNSTALPGSPVAGAGTGPGSAATGTKDRSSGRSMASHRSLVSVSSLGRRSRGISFRRRPSMPRAQPQPQAPTPGRAPLLPATSAAAFGSEYSTGGAAGVLNSGSGLASPASRGSVSGPLPDSPLGDGGHAPRCGPCGCVIS